MFAAITKYRTIISDYQKCLDEGAKMALQRAKALKDADGFVGLRKNSAMLKNYMVWAKGPGKCLAEAHGYILADGKKMDDLWKLYVGNGKLNLGSVPRDIMFAKYKTKQDVPDDKLEKARKKIMQDIYVMLRTTVDDYKKSDHCKAFLQRAYMVPQFTF